ncbi:histidine kinase dimerization/phospho-acceptor domain-containing protein [Cupriavidus basilensis]
MAGCAAPVRRRAIGRPVRAADSWSIGGSSAGCGCSWARRRCTGSGQLRRSGCAGDATDEHRQLEAAARRRAPLPKTRHRAKARFLATMTHEIRTPLAAVIGALELLRGSPMSARQAGEVALADNAARLLDGNSRRHPGLQRGWQPGNWSWSRCRSILGRALVESVMQVHQPAVAAKGHGRWRSRSRPIRGLPPPCWGIPPGSRRSCST